MFQENEFSFLKESLEKCGLSVTLVSPNDTVFDIIDERDITFFEKIFSSDTTLDNMLGGIKPNTLYKFKDSFSLLYNAFLLPQSTGRRVVVIGPFLQERLDEGQILELCQKNRFEPKYQKSINEFCAIIPILSPYNPIYVFLDSFCERMWDGKYTIVDIVSESASEQPSLTENSGRELDKIFSETKAMERRYAFENEILDAVTMGSESKLNKLFQAFNESFFERRVADPVRNAKNYGIIMNTLLRKAAERGGVHPIHLDKISSDFAIKIELFTSVEQGNDLMTEMFKAYCRLVREKSSSYSPIVKSAVIAIDTDLSAELSLSSLAKQLNVSNVYLSAIFKKETGKTVTEYINDKRISYAKHLLQTTSLQIQTVSLHCGIMDVHYFSKLFKQKTGKTPSGFRAEIMKRK
ncbi:MAG: helix-turn-helix domain-containing protein [Clostridia bacterium]|nr:helix-turn-helix domain-containing protein [Clostridia bacterium]